LRAVRGRHADFWQVTDDALAFAVETLELIETGLRDQLMRLYLRLTAPGHAATIALGRILHGKLVERLASDARRCGRPCRSRGPFALVFGLNTV